MKRRKESKSVDVSHPEKQLHRSALFFLLHFSICSCLSCRVVDGTRILKLSSGCCVYEVKSCQIANKLFRVHRIVSTVYSKTLKEKMRRNRRDNFSTQFLNKIFFLFVRLCTVPCTACTVHISLNHVVSVLALWEYVLLPSVVSRGRARTLQIPHSNKRV